MLYKKGKYENKTEMAKDMKISRNQLYNMFASDLSAFKKIKLYKKKYKFTWQEFGRCIDLDY